MKKFYEDEQYIKMCEKADEIQAIWQSMCKPISNNSATMWNYHYEEGYKGSFYYSKDEDEPEASVTMCVDYEYDTQATNGNKDIWLPRQDQLLEMLEVEAKKREKSVLWTLYDFNVHYVEYIFNVTKEEDPATITLLCVMNFVYKKVWVPLKEEWTSIE